MSCPHCSKILPNGGKSLTMHIKIAHRKRLRTAVDDGIPEMDVYDDPLVEEPVDVVCDTYFIFHKI
jgi:hypothetical protein